MERGEEEERRELSPTGVSTSTNPWEGGKEKAMDGGKVTREEESRKVYAYCNF